MCCFHFSTHCSPASPFRCPETTVMKLSSSCLRWPPHPLGHLCSIGGFPSSRKEGPPPWALWLSVPGVPVSCHVGSAPRPAPDFLHTPSLGYPPASHTATATPCHQVCSLICVPDCPLDLHLRMSYRKLRFTCLKRTHWLASRQPLPLFISEFPLLVKGTIYQTIQVETPELSPIYSFASPPCPTGGHVWSLARSCWCQISVSPTYLLLSFSGYLCLGADSSLSSGQFLQPVCLSSSLLPSTRTNGLLLGLSFRSTDPFPTWEHLRGTHREAVRARWHGTQISAELVPA